MYALCRVRVTLNPDSGKNDFAPDIVGSYQNCVYSPTLTDAPGNRKAKNWCICWLVDPANTTGSFFPITESVGDTTWGQLSNGRKTQIRNQLTANGIDSTWITDAMTIRQIVVGIAQQLQPGWKGRDGTVSPI